MSDESLEFRQTLQWPEGIDEQRFLDEYWQKKPLLFRQAFPDFETPLPADELAGLSLEPDTTGKIITQDSQGAYHLEYGPFEDDRFSTLTGNQWSLLVTDVEKHIPEFAAFLQPFRFIPDWRIDDLMVSYAPDGASVGAHVDEYDVFLLQASGVRTWHIDARTHVEHTMRQDGDLKILAHFQASDTWDLNPGDMLYLPPNMAHHGIAKGDECTTWSIGFRAPRLAELVARMAELISEQMSAQRYSDGQMKRTLRGEITPESIANFKSAWDQATRIDDENFACLLGRWLTESQTSSAQDNLPTDQQHPTKERCVNKHPFSRFAWSRIADSDNQATLFVDGNSYTCSIALAVALCSAEEGSGLEYAEAGSDEAGEGLECDGFNESEMALIQTLIDAGSLVLDLHDDD